MITSRFNAGPGHDLYLKECEQEELLLTAQFQYRQTAYNAFGIR